MKNFITTVALLSGIVAFAQETPKRDSASTKNIEEVIVTKKVIQKKSDRLIFDVAASPVAKGNTAFNLLKETPLVSSTDDKTLKIAGKSNAVIYINGKKTQMNADGLEAFLKNTPADNIAKIEVITLPGSEFNVEATDGVINIVLKKKMTDGTSGNFRMSSTQHKYNNQASSASLNYRKGKFAASGNVSYSDVIRPQDYLLMNGKGDEYNKSEGTVEGKDRDFGGYVNLDYEINEKNTVGVNYNGWFSKSPYLHSDFFNTVVARNQQGVLETHYNRSRNFGQNKDRNNSVNLNFEHKFDDKGSKLSLNGAYLNYVKDETNSNLTEIADAGNHFLALSSKFNQSTPQNIDNYSATADFTKIFKAFTLGLGGNFNKTKTDNDTYFENWNGTTYVKDDNQSNHFVYDEKISGLYLNAEKNITEKFSAKAGARVEFTDSYGEILGTANNVKRNYTNILPTLSLNYNINQNNSLSYAFTSRVRRPSFWEINPVRIYLTKVNYIQNNPFLKASSVYNQELMYMYKSAYFLQVSNSYTKDAITQVPLQKVDENGVRTLRYIRTNYGTQNTFSANLGMNKAFFNQIWNANYAAGLNINSYKGTVNTDPITGEKFEDFIFNNTMATPFLQLNNNIRLSAKKDLFLGINYFWMGKQRADLGYLNPIQRLDLSLKKIWNDWTFSFDMKDVFKTMKINIYDEQETGTYNRVSQYQYSQSAVLTVAYNFGNKKVQKTRNVQGAASDIKNRTGN